MIVKINGREVEILAPLPLTDAPKGFFSIGNRARLKG